jgi:integrase
LEAKRSVYGDGTITKRKDGRLQVTVMVGGKRQYAFVPARYVKLAPKQAWKLAEQKRRDLLALRDGGFGSTPPTLEAFLLSWLHSLETAKTRRVAYRTLQHYHLVVERHIIPALGSKRLDVLSERDVQRWLDADPAAPQTISHHRAVLRRALNVAVRQRLISRNPALAVELPRVPEFQGNPLTLEQARRLIEATADDPNGALWLLAIDTGWREGELLGLGRDDINLEAGTATLSAQLQRRDGEWVRVATKRPRQLATVSLSVLTTEALRRHLTRTAGERTTGRAYFGMLFLTPREQPIGQSTVLTMFHRACDKAGIPRRRVHDLRGTSATLLRELGVSEDVRMSRLGHATTKMARKYAQARVGSDRSAADALGGL